MVMYNECSWKIVWRMFWLAAITAVCAVTIYLLITYNDNTDIDTRKRIVPNQAYYGPGHGELGGKTAGVCVAFGAVSTFTTLGLTWKDDDGKLGWRDGRAKYVILSWVACACFLAFALVGSGISSGCQRNFNSFFVNTLPAVTTFGLASMFLISFFGITGLGDWIGRCLSTNETNESYESKWARRDKEYAQRKIQEIQAKIKKANRKKAEEKKKKDEEKKKKDEEKKKKDEEKKKKDDEEKKKRAAKLLKKQEEQRKKDQEFREMCYREKHHRLRKANKIIDLNMNALTWSKKHQKISKQNNIDLLNDESDDRLCVKPE